MLGNTRLVEHGIFTESRDILRAHVSISAGKVYVFTSGSAQDAFDSGREVGASQGNIQTSRGKVVSVSSIADVSFYPIPESYLKRARAYNPKTCDQSKKGIIALEIVKHMLKSGLIPISVTVSEITDETMQISGLDIIVKAEAKIQVKCDWNAGTPGTGNVYLETHECNPFRKH